MAVYIGDFTKEVEEMELKIETAVVEGRLEDALRLERDLDSYIAVYNRYNK